MASQTFRQSDTLAASGASTPIVINSGWLQTNGTWTGSFNLQTGPNDDGTWSNFTDASGNVITFTGNANCPLNNGIAMNMRVNWTRTTGTITINVTGNR